MTRSLPVTALFLLLLCGCLPASPPRAAINRQIDVFGLTLFAQPDLTTLRGAPSVAEPCLHGSEYRYDSLDLAVGVDRSGAIRRLATRNPATSLFGIRIGTTAGDARNHLLQAGFVPVGRDRYVQGWAEVTLLVDEAEQVFGLVIEVVE